MKFRRAFYMLVFIVLFLGVVSATTNLEIALRGLCTALRDLVPIAAMLMVLLAAVIYSTGQLMGAETRARANVWATSCLTGALIGLLITAIAPEILSVIYNGVTGSVTC